MRAIEAGALPQVTFYKPAGRLTQHPSYTDILSGDEHLNDLLTKLQKSPQWKSMLVIITYDENQLILSETAFRAADIPNAALALNNVRSRYGKSLIAAPTLADIMTEKYISLFQNIEAWNDYKRTCLPVLKPARGKTRIPGRLFYGSTEEQTNPNTKPTGDQNLFSYRNANDPNGCQ